MWTAAILDGGTARRMGGQDKSALAVGARSIRERQLAVLRGLTPHILIIGRDGIPDRVPDRGALGGIYTALLEAPTDPVLILAGDMPFVTAPFLAHLAAAGEDAAWAVVLPVAAAGRHPLCAMYRRRVAALVKAHMDRGDLRVQDAVAGMQVRELGTAELSPFNRDGRLLTNVNTPEDYARAQAR
jgi:molybdopterin-guanine dinucleotide biosynthesis protein A